MNESLEELDGSPNRTPSGAPGPKLKGVIEYLLIIRDRWLLAIALSLPISLWYVYDKYQEPEIFKSSATFAIQPPLSIINNMQPIERDKYSARMVGDHLHRLKEKELRQRVVKAIESEKAKKAILLAPYVKDKKEQETLPTVAQVVNYRIDLIGKGTPTLQITAEARNAEGAQLVANLVQVEYERAHKSRKGQNQAKSLTFLAEQKAESRKNEDEIINQINLFKTNNNLTYIEDDKKDNAERKSQYQNAITTADVKLLEIESHLVSIRAIHSKVVQSLKVLQVKGPARTTAKIKIIEDFFKISAIAKYGNVNKLRSELQELEKTRKTYEAKYLENHPRMQENADTIGELHKILLNEVQVAIEDLTNQKNELNVQKTKFATERDRVKKKAQILGQKEQAIRRLEQNLALERETYSSLHKREKEVEVTGALPEEQTDPLQVGDVAMVPHGPVSPDKAAIKTKGILIFFACFVIIPIAFEFIDNRVKSPWDIEVFIGRDLVAGIPKISTIKEADRPLIVGNELDDSLMESFRSMFSRIQMNSRIDYPKSMLITSAIPSEGKSLLAANLAYSCANHGRRTILIDFDLRRPGLHKFCGVSNDRGLLTLVNEINGEHGTEAERNALTEIYPNLYVLPSGGKTRAATEMLERPDFDHLLNNLKKLCDILIIDSPPLGLFPDSMAMARKVDEVLFVTRYGKVARKVVKNLLSRVDETGANVLGVVLNDLPEKKTPGYYYAGYYGYGYFRYKYYNKYYGGQEDTESEPPKEKAS